MKGFQKLALVTAIVSSSSAFAMQAMDDENLSATTGQDGITINAKADISGAVLTWKDADGFTGATDAGVVLVDGLGVNTGTAGAIIKIDAGTNGTDSALNINVDIASLTVSVGKIFVGDSTIETARTGGTEILDISSDITVTGLKTNIELGKGPQGALIAMSGTISDITIGNLSIKDQSTNGGGAIVLGNFKLKNLVLDGTKVNVTTNGLVVQMSGQTLGLSIDSVKLGSTTAASIGRIELSNINMGATSVTISGH